MDTKLSIPQTKFAKYTILIVNGHVTLWLHLPGKHPYMMAYSAQCAYSDCQVAATC